MAQTRYFKIKEMLAALLKREGANVSQSRLRKEIIKNIGCSEYRVIRPTLQIMMDTDLIKDKGNYFEINKKEVLQ